MLTLFRPALVLFLVLTVITGIFYPLSVTVIGKIFFNQQVNGSLLREDNKIVGSMLIGQAFEKPQYFWSRPSATTDKPYNGLASGGSNLAPTNPEWISTVQSRIQKFKASDPNNSFPIPYDLVMASASGLDPHISLAAAQYQISRVAQYRKSDLNMIKKLIETYTELPTWGFLGETRVNVLKLNLALDKLAPVSP
jgi:potassium-transporting ATPase KdpC subunit